MNLHLQVGTVEESASMATANAASVPAVAASTGVVQAATLGAAAPEPKSTSVVWTVVLEDKFIGIWGEEFLRIKQGNFRPHNWTFVAQQINEELPEDEPHFTIKQCQTKLNTLKKRFSVELKKKTSTGSVHSSWVHFKVLDLYLKKLAKVAGIPGAIDSGLTKVPSPEKSEQENLEGEKQEAYVGENAGAESETTPQATAEQIPASTKKSKSPALERDTGKRKSAEGAAEEVDCQEISPTIKFEKKLGVNGQLNGRAKIFKSSWGSASKKH
jgi:hypothetical protein